MDKVKLTKESLFRTIQEVVKEISTTGGNSTAGATAMPGPGEQTFTSKAFKKKVKESNTSAPFGKNFKHSTHPEAKAMDYKELWEGKFQIGTDTKTDSGIFFEPETGAFYINVIDGAGNRTNKLQVNTIDDVLAKFPNWKWTEQGKAEFSDTLNENYARFRNETKTRTKPEQFHNAVKSVKQKVNEINRLFEYMNRLQTELSESEGGLKHKKYTDKAIQSIKESTKQLFFKSTKLK